MPPRPWRILRKRRRVALNEPTRPAFTRSASSSRWELYQWHKRMGTLHIYFDLYPSS